MPSSPTPRRSLPALFAGAHSRRSLRRPVRGERDQATAAAETVALVLAEDSPLPETAGDVEELVVRLRGHILRLGALLPSDEQAVACAQRLASLPLPDGYVPSRRHLVRLAEATRDVIAALAPGGPPGEHSSAGGGRRVSSRNAVRALMVGAALIALVVAGTVLRT
ncbi:hypothetical protein [Streptomyces sp. NPDC059631]|uniref:hypothetical protein n=1 Tax=unclassified Streptomyces TaxID=2593676 RepID=UPI00369E4B3C